MTQAPEKKAELVGDFEGEFCWQINVGGYTLVSVSYVLDFQGVIDRMRVDIRM